ncbi:exodeoxyribonuclease VII small subunit [Belliella kenyensis]|uniref:Exodeoxyribonuclease VII small subunit n=1 Tax=Belliella kenyensis TaxID=1472724 RepID=A0ABV8END0_9BACT|nr:exodeoxyribonuclease VII small subunit [Belliella kenyensis]MCH7400489.1 exodeoxyribonuclease VII small subunit [Belliella kenyensis]MDN3604495.1 exodeoxyribonuclease VII small subunit [Belliella kenyensis]
MENENLSYDQAIKRIEEIVSILEEGNKGIDQLSELVKEASTLVKRCREKLRNTEIEINKAFED